MYLLRELVKQLYVVYLSVFIPIARRYTCIVSWITSTTVQTLEQSSIFCGNSVKESDPLDALDMISNQVRGELFTCQ